MDSRGTTGIEAPPRHERVLGRLRGSAGPTLIALGGIHGNEPSGITAARRVLARLEASKPALRGELVLLAGNLTALSAGRRFCDFDMNRQWSRERAASFAEEPRPDEPVEWHEQRELLATVARIAAEARGPVYFIDLHTSSADGPPFLTVGDTLRNRSFASHFPLPLILGLEEQIDGALLELLDDYGLVTLGVEAGQHDAPSSADRHEAVLSLALEAAGLLPAGAVADRDAWRRILIEASRGVPPVIEVRHRHAIGPRDEFRMEPGFVNFQAVRKGQLLARDRQGRIEARADGRMLLPLYQGLGDDGFFLSREVRPVWMRISEVLRRLGFGAVVRLLPGVLRHPREREVLVVDTRIARFYPLEIFHLFGYRKRRRLGSVLLVSRRRYDRSGPKRIRIP